MNLFRPNFSLSILGLLLLLAIPSFAKTTHKPEAIQAAYIFNFLKYIEWPEESDFNKINIAYIGNNGAYISELKKLDGRKIRGKTLSLSVATSLDKNKQFQAIVVDKRENSKLRTISRSLYGKSSLLISDNAKDKKLIMLNFTSVDSATIGFEVNRYNMINEKLKVSSDILVLGGTELDIAQLLRDMEQELESNQTQLREQADKLENIEDQVSKREKQLARQANELEKLKLEVGNKEAEITSQKRQLSKQSREIAQQSKDLEEQAGKLKISTSKLQDIQKELRELDEALVANRSEMAQSSKELNQKQLEISSKESFIKELSTLINKNKQLLSEQKAHIESQASAISKQQDDIETQHQEIEFQSSKIQQQNIFLIVAWVILTLVILLIIVILRSAKATKQANANLAAANEELELTNKLLNDTQGQLVESEKMAALGGLVAGVAHEINTPLGVSVTAATHLSERIDAFTKQYRSGSLKRTELEALLEDAEESTTILNRNLDRASTLVGNFKQIATDQTVEDIRDFELNHYFEEISQSLSPQLKKKQHHISIDCDEEIKLYSYPGAIAQVFTNLVMNSVIHGFEDRTNGEISFLVEQNQDTITITYRDDGSGINDEQRAKIFDPFYTTKRAAGGTGLGMHICYNLITQKLKGTIVCLPSTEGALFEISLPKSVKG